jgi:ketosteroid isomerase-like protein
MADANELAEIYRAITRAVTAGDNATLERHIAEDVVWNGGPPAGFTGRATFFVAVAKFREMYAEWEVIPHTVLARRDEPPAGPR